MVLSGSQNPTHADFGEDKGTMWLTDGPAYVSRQTTGRFDAWRWEKHLRRVCQRRPLVWFVDDELANRKWFVENPRNSGFAVVTFSNRDFVHEALSQQIPCDALVTDIFFPATAVRTDEDARNLMAIYEAIENARVADLKHVWDQHKNKWRLDGFEIAKDVAQAMKKRREKIPVFLFSRKAPLLLTSQVDELVGIEPSYTMNARWLIEKVDPSVTGATAGCAAAIQRARIEEAIRDRQAAEGWLWRFLDSVSLGSGPASVNVGALLRPKGAR